MIDVKIGRSYILKVYRSTADPEALRQLVSEQYGIGFNEFRLFRDIGGSIYMTADNTTRYVFKLYKRPYTAKALKAVKVCAYLKDNGFPIVNIIPTPSGDHFIEVDMPEGNRIGVLYEHLEGHTATADDIPTLGATASQLHHLLSKYPEPLPVIGKKYFIDCLIEELSAFGYDTAKISELVALGNELWEDVKDLPIAGIHGDLDLGNIIKSPSGKFTYIDIDNACLAPHVYDIVCLCDKTDFFSLNRQDIDNTIATIHSFMDTYQSTYPIDHISDKMIEYFMALRRFAMQGHAMRDVMPTEGCHRAPTFLDATYNWLMEWKRLC